MIKNQQIKLIHKQIPINLHCILRYKMIKYQQLYQLIENDQFATQFDQLHFMSNINAFHSIVFQLQFMSNLRHKMIKHQQRHKMINSRHSSINCNSLAFHVT